MVDQAALLTPAAPVLIPIARMRRELPQQRSTAAFNPAMPPAGNFPAPSYLNEKPLWKVHGKTGAG